MYRTKLRSNSRFDGVIRRFLRHLPLVFLWLPKLFLVFGTTTLLYFVVQAVFSWKEAALQQRYAQQRLFFNDLLSQNGNISCSEVSSDLLGALNMTLEEPTFEEIAKRNPFLRPGGYYRPSKCNPTYGPTVFVIPYRNRESHLRIFLNHMHPILQRQQIEYMIVVVEQSESASFNRALLMNIGYNESLSLLPQKRQFQCFVFHDVDLIPENDTATFTCNDTAVHLSGYLEQTNYKVLYPKLFGGASALHKQLFEVLNGYSNLYFGWGSEDDDFRKRITDAKITVTRPPKELLTYRMVKHQRDSFNANNPIRCALLKKAAERVGYDGLNSMVYRVLRKDRLPTHVRLVVEFTQAEVEAAVFRKQLLLGIKLTQQC